MSDSGIDDRLETSINLFVLVFAKHGTRYAGETMVSVFNSSHSTCLGISNKINCNQLFRLLQIEWKERRKTSRHSRSEDQPKYHAFIFGSIL